MSISPLTIPEVIDAAMTDAATQILARYAQANSERLQAAPTRFPVQVNQQTRVYLECYATALGTSLSSVCGLILNRVVAVTLQTHLRPSEESAQRA